MLQCKGRCTLKEPYCISTRLMKGILGMLISTLNSMKWLIKFVSDNRTPLVFMTSQLLHNQNVGLKFDMARMRWLQLLSQRGIRRSTRRTLIIFIVRIFILPHCVSQCCYVTCCSLWPAHNLPPPPPPPVDSTLTFVAPLVYGSILFHVLPVTSYKRNCCKIKNV